jgi:hypothetical protein
VKHSEETLKPLMILLAIMNNKYLEIPDIKKLKKSKFPEFYGWGLAHTKSFFD